MRHRDNSAADAAPNVPQDPATLRSAVYPLLHSMPGWRESDAVGVVALPSARSTPAVPPVTNALLPTAFIETTAVEPAEGLSSQNGIAQRGGRSNNDDGGHKTTAVPIAHRLLGCFRVDRARRRAPQRLNVDREHNSPALCAGSCRAAGFQFAEVVARVQCWCGNVKPLDADKSLSDDACALACPRDPTATCGGGQHASVLSLSGQQVVAGHPDESAAAGAADPSTLKPTITFYVEPAKTRNALFLSGRLARHARSDSKYRYVTVVLSSRLAKNITAFRYETCVATPGYKVFVGHGELVLTNWPGNSVWSVTGDEAGDWGLKRMGKYYGLHGPGMLFPSNESLLNSPIILPDYAKPWFRQYYDDRQVICTRT
jgi:hypothetical protein